ncbi:hypothetical protein QUF56_06235 [Ureibacillus composti]|nr:hypothetical protein [Ureibacillus composti]
MKNTYPMTYAVCVRCAKTYNFKDPKIQCPYCKAELQLIKDIHNDDELIKYRKLANERFAMWRAFNPTQTTEEEFPLAIPKFSFEILLTEHITSRFISFNVIKFSKGKGTILVEYGLGYYAHQYNGGTVGTIHPVYQFIGHLHQLLLDKSNYKQIESLLVKRKELIGIITDASNSTSNGERQSILQVYISPDKNEYLEIATADYRKVLKIELEERNKEREQYNRIQRELKEQRDRKYWAEKSRALDLHKKNHGGILSFFAPKLREANCYRCEEHLFSSTHLECSICKWMICTCGACGCQYIKKAFLQS